MYNLSEAAIVSGFSQMEITEQKNIRFLLQLINAIEDDEEGVKGSSRLLHNTHSFELFSCLDRNGLNTKMPFITS